jgi:hypothetical protein
MQMMDNDTMAHKEALQTDHQLILSLLNEYSEKLTAINRQIEALSDEFAMKYFALGRNIILLVFIPYLAWYLFSTLSKNYISIDYLFVFYPLVALLMTPLVYSYLITTRRLKRRLVADSRIIAAKLEKIIRVASQAQDHLDMDYGLRLEFDIRLAEAESAVSHFTYNRRSAKNAI